MKLVKTPILLSLAMLLVVSQEACRSKKLAQKKPTAEVETPAPETPAPKPVPAPPAEPAQEETAPAKPDYNFRNIQFEFNSAVLKTDSYPILDKAAAAMKQDPSVKFLLSGHASAEGTPEHNNELSIERANAVKTYLVNTGVLQSQLALRGFGATKPLASNDTEEGRAVNRRVEIKKVN